MHLLGNLILVLRVRDNFFVLEHELFVFTVLPFNEFVMRGRTPESTLLSSVGTSRVFGVLEIISNFVEAVLRNGIFPISSQVSAVDYSVNKFPRL
jgi:hypothetical protein